MKITFLGTSHGVPSAERYCSSIMLESNGSVYFIDCGAPLIDLYLRQEKDLKDFRALFTTHTHGDHTVGALSLINLMNWYYRDTRGDFYFTTETMVDAIKHFVYAGDGESVDEKRIRFHVPSAGLVYEDEYIRVEYIPTEHCAYSYSVLVTEGDRRVLFGGDFSYNLLKDDIPKITEEPIDAFVCEMAHFTLPMLTPYLERCRAKRIFFTHVFPLEKYNDIETIKGTYPFEILTPADGDSYEI